jgi:hypothetical protein
MNYSIIISNEEFNSTLTTINITNGYLIIQGINIAKINRATISLLKLNVSILSKEIGKLHTKLNLTKRTIDIYFEPTSSFLNKYKIILKYFKKQKDGRLKYEYKLF